VRTSRAPLQIYNFIWGPAALGFEPNYSTGTAIVEKVSPEGAAARGGLRTGDRIVAVNRIPIRGEGKDFDLDYRAAINFAPRQPILIEVERQCKPLALTVRLERKSPSNVKWRDWQALGVVVFPFALALGIVFRRPQDPTARIGAWLLASMAIDLIFVSSGWASIWRRQPGVLGLFVWPASISRSLISGITITFAIFFPRNLVRKRVLWILIWLPVVLGATLQNLAYWRLVYRPEEAPTALGLVDLYTIHRIMTVLAVCCVLSTVPLFAIQYDRLMDINEKRHMHVLFAGAIVCSLAATTLIFFGDIRVSPPVYGVLSALYALGPLTLAYAVLRHRVFDLGVILRRGLQYALARRLLASAVPMLPAFSIIDLLMHRDQSILAVFRARGWMYTALSGLAAVAFIKRQNWLDALDRRFFRERYDGRRLLREVVEEMRAASSFVEEAPRVATRIEAALHPEFVAFLVCQPSGTSYHTLSVVPPRTAPLTLKEESKLSSLIRLLRKPLEIPQTESGWLQQQLPHEETEFLRQVRVDLLVPYFGVASGNRAFLVMEMLEGLTLRERLRSQKSLPIG
jgi:eukaryotic-like serine/threonine-protein kinase